MTTVVGRESADRTPTESEFTADYGVIGLGSVGSMALWHLSSTTDSVTGLEGGTFGHDNCAVGGDTRLYRRIYREGAEYEEVLQDSLDHWRKLEAESGRTVLEQTGMLSIVPRGSEDEGILKGHAEEAGLDYTELTADEIAEAYPQFAVDEDSVGILDPQGGFLRTDVAVTTALGLSASHGADLRARTVVTEVASDATGVTVSTDDGSRFRFRKVVITGGARTVDLLPPETVSVFEPLRVPMTWFGMQNPDLFARGSFPVFGFRREDGSSVYGTCSIDGSMVKISGAIPNSPLEREGFEFDQTISMDERALAGEVASTFFKGITPYPVRATAYADLYSKDRAPVIDWVDAHERVLVASGFSGKGFKMSIGLGHIVSDVLLGVRDPDPLFVLDRPGLKD